MPSSLSICSIAGAVLPLTPTHPPTISSARYGRLSRGALDELLVVMDAPPDLEDVLPFSALSELLNSYGYSAPRILGKDVENGFLLLDDFGDSTYTKALASGENEQALYALALDLLVDLRHRLVDGVPDSVPAYDDDKLLAEAALFIDWYLVRGIELRITDT